MSRSVLGLLLPVVCVLGSCTTPPPSSAEADRRNQAVELAGRLQDIADVAATAFAGEVTNLRLDGADDLQTFAAETVRNNAVAYIRSIALDEDPGTALVDLYAFAQLGRWACENRARLYADLFVEDCDGTYGVVLDRTRRLVERWMTAEQIARIDDAVARFKDANPDRTRIGIVRLPELARTAGTTTASLRTASPTLFSPVTEAAEQLELTRLLGARLLWLLSRLPEAIGWRAQTVLMEALASDAFGRIGEIADTLVRSIDSLDERLDRTGESVDGLASGAATLSSDLGAVAAAADRLAASVATVEPLAESLDRTGTSLDGIAKELLAFEDRAVRVGEALVALEREGGELRADLSSLADRIDGLGGSIETLHADVAGIEDRIGGRIERILDGLIWKVASAALGVVAFAGVVVFLAVRFGRR